MSNAVRLAGFALSLALCQCTSEDAATSDAGAGTGGAGATSGSGGTGAAASGGSSGSGASGGGTDAGEWGAAPQWEPIPGTVAGCSLERLTNPGQVRLFQWTACTFAANCEEAEFGPAMKWLGFNPSSTVHDDGTTVRIAFSFAAAVFVTGANGIALDGLRHSNTSDCALNAASVWSEQIAVQVSSGAGTVFGGALATVGAAGMDTFTMSNPPPGTPGPFLLGAKRWLWGWAPVNRLSSFDLTGGDFQLFAPVPLGGPALLFTGPAAAGSLFLFQEYDEKDGGTFQGKIAWSDGIQPPATYLQPPSPDDDYGNPAYAHSHVGFLKGIGRKNVNSYDSVELWASPFSEDPNKLVPQLVEKLPSVKGMSKTIGGYGHVAGFTWLPPDNRLALDIWNLQSMKQKIVELPKDYNFKNFLGVSRSHLWVCKSKPNLGGCYHLVRVAVD